MDAVYSDPNTSLPADSWLYDMKPRCFSMCEPPELFLRIREIRIPKLILKSFVNFWANYHFLKEI